MTFGLQLMMATASGPDWASVVTAVGTGVLGLTALVGVVAANNRLRRATGEITAAAFNGPGITGIRVRTTVRSTGLGRLRLAEESNKPTIRVTEVQVGDDQEQVPGTSWEKPVLAGEVIDPGETASATFTFLVSPASPRTLGWEVAFQFAVYRRGRTKKQVWFWSDTTLVAPPARGRPSSRQRYYRNRR